MTPKAHSTAPGAMPQVPLHGRTPEALKGSSPPLSQQVLYSRDALRDISKGIARLYREVPTGSATLLGVAWGLGEIERELTVLARELREREEKAGVATPWQRI